MSDKLKDSFKELFRQKSSSVDIPVVPKTKNSIVIDKRAVNINRPNISFPVSPKQRFRKTSHPDLNVNANVVWDKIQARVSLSNFELSKTIPKRATLKPN